MYILYSHLFSLFNNMSSKRQQKILKNQAKNPLYIRQRQEILENSLIAAQNDSLAWMRWSNWSLGLRIRVLVNLALMIVMIYAEFGLVCFVLSIFYWMIWYGTATTSITGKKSAYSVFNEGYERLTGDKTAEELEQELRRGGGI